jgi:hydroxypyruvate reductase
MADVSRSRAANLLDGIFQTVAKRVDGARLVRGGVARDPSLLRAPCSALLAFGKVSFPMTEGLLAAARAAGVAAPARGLVIAPASRFPAEVNLPAGFTALVSDHPNPTQRSVAAGREALEFVGALAPSDRLLVLVSGGGSALVAAPAPGLTLEDKRAAVRAVSRAGATIGQLNAVRKHLSALKGGGLALATRAPTTVLALSDVVGNDPGTIASGPFAADASTFAEALELVTRWAPDAPTAVRAHLQRGVAGEIPETPKPGDPRLAHVDFRLLAGPESVPEEAEAAALTQTQVPAREDGLKLGVLARNTELDVRELAGLYGQSARLEAFTGGPRVLIGNGEPTVVVTGQGRGGRATHLALMVARDLAGLPGVAFLAAGTDDRDGSAGASGAVVDGDTWNRALAAGLDPAAALSAHDSATLLDALGALVRGPGTSNLLDLHLLAVGVAD